MVGCLDTIPNKRVDTGGRLGEEREFEPAQFLLLEQGIENERFTESGSEVARAEGVDAILGTIGSSMWVSRVLRGKGRGSSVNSDKIRGHGKEILTKRSIVINML